MASFTFLVAILALVSILDAQKPEKCGVAIIGAGMGGVYSAWRLAVDSGAVQPSDICIFEAKARPGGRVLSVSDPVPGFEGFTVDLGAYR